MFIQPAFLGALLLAGQSAATATVHTHALFHPSADIESALRRDAQLMATLSRRQDANPADGAAQVSTTPASGDPSSPQNIDAWEEQTEAACNNAITKLGNQASNPSGLAVCYNLPYLDNRTGVFSAELRLYKIAEPINPWVGIAESDINMSLAYLGAKVQTMDPVNMKVQNRGVVIRAPADGSIGKRQDSTQIRELKVLHYVGQINSNLMGSAMTEETLQPLLVPQIELSARDGTVKTTLSAKEATFVSGVFANETTATATDPVAQAAATAAAFNAQPFQLPGTNLAFFPVGLVVTCVWTACFILSVGLGTLGRIQFRDQYRRRVKVELSKGVRTI